MAEYALERLRAIGWEAWRHKNSVTVVLRRPSDAIARKWQLALQQEWAHVITMPHVTRERIDRLVEELAASKGSSGPKGSTP
jgi:histidine decarboxylase